MTAAQLAAAHKHRHGWPRRRGLHRDGAASRIWAILEAYDGERWTLEALAAMLPDLKARAIARAAHRLANYGLVRRELTGHHAGPSRAVAVFYVTDRAAAHEARLLWEAGLVLCHQCPTGFPTEKGRDQHQRRYCQAPPW